jgi:hypothetical protein
MQWREGWVEERAVSALKVFSATESFDCQCFLD